MTLRACASIALGGWIVVACGASDPSAPLPTGAVGPSTMPSESPPAAPADSSSLSDPSAPMQSPVDPAPVAETPTIAGPVAEGPAAEGPDAEGPDASGGESTGEQVGGDLPISSDPTGDDPTSQGEGGEGELSALTIWIAGDSTVANGNTPCPRGWGGAFASHFNDRVTVTNSAVGGRSVHTWLYEVQDVFDEETGECALTRDAGGQPTLQPRWQAMLDGMQAGDYLFIQFGINDGDPTCDRHVGIDAFITAYGMMAAAAKERGSHPIFLTPVSSIACDGATARGSRGAFVPATLGAGEQFDVPVIDLHERSVALYQERGFCPVEGGDVSAATSGPVGDFFCDDHTHFSSAGALEIADVVVQALIEQAIPLAAYLR
jgi:lysophospholipase L1-like esterase